MSVSGRFLRLQALLGAAPDDFTFEDLRRVVIAGIPESEDHEYKSQAPERDELAKDVAALANAGGGVIFVGVDEDRLGVAEALVDVDSDDAEFRRVTETITARIHPFPSFRLRSLVDAEGVSRQYMIIVYGSPGTPHATTRTDGTVRSYPIRAGTLTRYLREPEVAAAYSARAIRAAQLSERLDHVWNEGVDRVPKADEAWLAVASAPAQAGSFPIDATAVSRAYAWLQTWSLERRTPAAVSVMTATIGRRRLVLGEANPTRTCFGPLITLHSDGSGFAALRLTEGAEQHRLLPNPVLRVLDDDLDQWVLTLLGLLSAFAVEAGSGGDLDIRAQLLPSGEAPNTPIALAMVDRALPNYWIPWGPRNLVVGTQMTTQTVSMSVADNAADLVSASAYLVADIAAEFGEPEPVMLRTNGSLDLAHLRRNRDLISAWAGSVGVVALEQSTPR
jgi:hypothetical protein